MPAQQWWLHEIREGVRHAYVREELRKNPRQDMEGLGAARLDFEGTAFLYRGRAATPEAKAILEEAHESWGSRPTPRELAALAFILAGGPRTQHRLFSAGMRKSPSCPAGCDCVEDQDHLWWQCPKWSAWRARFPEEIQEPGARWRRTTNFGANPSGAGVDSWPKTLRGRGRCWS